MESGWLLERRRDGKIEWVMLAHGMWGWTEHSEYAFRMARRQDADDLAEIIDDAEHVTEHQWG